MTGLAGDRHRVEAPRPGPRLSWAELGPRVASATVMAALALGTAWVGGSLFDLFWLIAGALVLAEWYKLVGLRRRGLAGLAGTFAMLAALQGVGRGDLTFAVVALAVGALLAFAIAEPGERGFAVSGLLYAGLPVLALVLLRRAEPFGAAAIVWLFAVVWGTDVMAFFGGRLVGGPKLAPRLSPSKTWSGFLIGIGSGGVLGLLVAPAEAASPPIVALGLVAGAGAQGGDLFESWMKRRFGVKDSGRLIPGHGGLMDRLDGFFAAACLIALLGLLRGGVEGAASGLFRW